MTMIGNETVVVKRNNAVTEDAYGLPQTVVTETTIQRCLISWGSITAELTIETSQNTDTAVVQMPLNSDVRASDEIIIRGQVFAVDGNPVRWEVPRGFSIKPKLWVQVKKVDR